jgi:uncharacterized protein YndB with AHSA1/START domain
MSDTFTFTQTVTAAPKTVYRAFTSPMLLRHWFCDRCEVAPREGGSYFFAWNAGHHAMGVFTRLEPERAIAFTWRGMSDPAETWVEVTLTPEGDATRVEVSQGGIGQGEDWENLRREIARGWQYSLENLQSVVETGIDQRFARRPMLGIMPDVLTEEIAGKLGVPVTEGMSISSVVEGMGAQAAGLESGDVIVSLAGVAVKDWGTLQGALSRLQAGDTTEVEFYRGSEKRRVDMTLSKRQMPEIPLTPGELADALREKHMQLDAELDQLVAGIPEEIMAARPGANEWSANENLAHLIFTERFQQMWLWSIVGGDDWIGWRDNNITQIAGILAVHPSSAELIAEFKRAEASTAAAVAALPASFPQEYKSAYIQWGQNQLNLSDHTREHLEQMRLAVEAVKQAGQVAT